MAIVDFFKQILRRARERARERDALLKTMPQSTVDIKDEQAVEALLQRAAKQHLASERELLSR